MFRSVRRGVAPGLMVLCVSAAGAQPEAADSTWGYRVAPGDTLSAVAQTYLDPAIGWRRLQQLNRVANPKRLQPGRELRIPVAWLRGEATVATVAYVMGRAHREAPQDGVDPSQAPALKVGDTLQPGDLLVTEADANVTLRLADSTRVLVSGNSRVRLDSLLSFGRSGITSSQLSVERGEADSRVNPNRTVGTRYDIRTPVLTLGVRGTEFRVRVAEGDSTTRAEVTQGRVAAAPPRQEASQSSSPGSGKARAQPARVSAKKQTKEQIKQMRAQTKERAIDAGFGLVANAGSGIKPAQPLPSAPGLSTLPTQYERVPLSFSWPPLSGTSAYRAQVFADDSLNQRLLDGVFERPAAQWADLPDGHYLLQVRARNAEGLEGQNGQLMFTLKARPEPPFTNAPRDTGRVYGDRVTLGWTKALAAQRYRLQVATDARFETPLLDRADVKDAEFNLPLAPGRYHWRLASIAEGDDQGPFSDVSSFDLREVPPPPPVAPPTAEDGKLAFRWRARWSDDLYDVQVAHDAAFKQLLLERRENLPELFLKEPSAGTYYLRVRTIDADGFVGAYGSAQQFEVRHSLWWWLVPGVILLLVM